MQKIKVGDSVQVIAGKFKGTVGNIVKKHKLPKNQLSYSIEGVMMKKTQKADPQKERSAAIVDIYRPIHASNVKLYDAKEQKSSRVAIKIDENGKKYRVFKKTGNTIEQ